MPLLTKKQIAQELAMPLTHIQTLTRQRKIPVYRLSAKCIRFDLEKVKQALAQFEVAATAPGLVAGDDDAASAVAITATAATR